MTSTASTAPRAIHSELRDFFGAAGALSLRTKAFPAAAGLTGAAGEELSFGFVKDGAGGASPSGFFSSEQTGEGGGASSGVGASGFGSAAPPPSFLAPMLPKRTPEEGAGGVAQPLSAASPKVAVTGSAGSSDAALTGGAGGSALGTGGSGAGGVSAAPQAEQFSLASKLSFPQFGHVFIVPFTSAVRFPPGKRAKTRGNPLYMYHILDVFASCPQNDERPEAWPPGACFFCSGMGLGRSEDLDLAAVIPAQEVRDPGERVHVLLRQVEMRG